MSSSTRKRSGPTEMDTSSSGSRGTLVSSTKSSSLNYQITYLFISTIVIVTCIKLMLIPSYYSTDFEVHRNWMAITSNLPISKWYTENTSQWTLDYPPFFAYFELFLSYFAAYFDPQMLQITAQPYTSTATVLYQRLTVILSDIVYYYAVYQWLRLLTDSQKQKIHGLTLCTRSPWLGNSGGDLWTSSAFLYIFLFVFNVGHLIVDHIHFQYNGLLNGLLLLSMARMVNGEIYWSAFWFSVLLNFKHIYLYMAPAYFVYLLVEHCLVINRQEPLRSKVHFKVLVTLAAIVLTVFAASFGPFIAKGQLTSLLSRLFPFQRGLTHAYWAPNFWALYNGVDVIAAKLLGRSQIGSGQTGGLVQQSEHSVLLSISPRFSLFCVILVIGVISVIYTWNRTNSSPASTQIRRRRSVVFIELVLLSTLSFFVFGYHVHEKAILLVLPPMIPLVLAGKSYARLFLLLSITGYYSLFPLLHQQAETPIKILLLTIHVFYSFLALGFQYPRSMHTGIRFNFGFKTLPLLNWPESLYIIGFIPLQALYSIGPCLAASLFARYQFVPLMATSLYCSVGVIYCFGGLARQMAIHGTREEAFKVN